MWRQRRGRSSGRELGGVARGARGVLGPGPDGDPPRSTVVVADRDRGRACADRVGRDLGEEPPDVVRCATGRERIHATDELVGGRLLAKPIQDRRRLEGDQVSEGRRQGQHADQGARRVGPLRARAEPAHDDRQRGDPQEGCRHPRDHQSRSGRPGPADGFVEEPGGGDQLQDDEERQGRQQHRQDRPGARLGGAPPGDDDRAQSEQDRERRARADQPVGDGLEVAHEVEREDGERQECREGAGRRDRPELGQQPAETGDREEDEHREEDRDDGATHRFATAAVFVHGDDEDAQVCDAEREGQDVCEGHRRLEARSAARESIRNRSSVPSRSFRSTIAANRSTRSGSKWWPD